MTMTYDTPAPVQWLTAAQYADQAGASERTVKRWLADGELPGATKDERGRWLIPADTTRTPGADVVPLAPRHMTRPMTTQQPGPELDALPSFLSIDQAAHILGITAYAIRKHREYFDAQPFGPNGALVIPLATIRKVRGA